MGYIKNDLWKKYRLSIAESIVRTFHGPDDFKEAEKQHDMVVDYLERHPKEQEEYLKTLRYWDIVLLAEKEINKQFEHTSCSTARCAT